MNADLFERYNAYCVEFIDRRITVRNFNYEMIFEGIAPDDLDIISELSGCESPEEYQKDSQHIYLYNSNTNPFDKQRDDYNPVLMSQYSHREMKLKEFLRKIKRTDTLGNSSYVI